MKFENQRKRTLVSTIEIKAKITTSKLGNVESKIEEIRAKIDQSRRQRMIEAKVDKEKMSKLKNVQNNVKYTSIAIGENKGNTGKNHFFIPNFCQICF